MMNKHSLSLLSDEEIWGSDFGINKEKQLDVIKNYGVMASISDLCILTGCFYRRDYYNDIVDGSVNDKTGAFWTRSCNHNGICIVNEVGDRGNEKGYKRSNAIRPLLKSDSIYSYVIDNKYLGYNQVPEVEFGYYPFEVVPYYMQKLLEEEYLKGMDKTGCTYTFDMCSSNDYNHPFSKQTYDEYIFRGQRYVRIKANSPYGSWKFELSNNQNYRNNDYVWVKVKPVKWLVDEKNKLLLSKIGLLSGIRYIDSEHGYNGVFESTEMYYYLNQYMIHDLLQATPFEKDITNSLDDVKRLKR